eukprot:XP_003964287.1 PREDICTED: mcKusick-Kaufman/Bardet-Biedl syndromes putative chaperonin [Takifugu rubripes]
MSRLVKKSPSVCTDLPLDTTDSWKKLRVLLQLLKSCFGPKGRLKLLHNSIGGHVVTTSTSSVLLSAISSSLPLINLIKTSILNHVGRFGDCGLFAAIFCLTLIEQSRQSGLRGRAAAQLNKHLLDLCTVYLRQEDCGCKMELGFNSSHNLTTLASSIISSKPACVLTQSEVLHMSKLSVQAFLLTVPCSSTGVKLGETVTVPVEGPPVKHSAVFPGLLVDMPDLLSLDKAKRPHLRPLRAVVFSASLAGDLSDTGDGVIEVHEGEDTDSQILDRLLELGKQVVEDEVKLFVCQKVVHPVLQQYLRSQDVLVVERLGVALMEPLLQLTGANPVATLHTPVPAEAYGTVHDLGIRQFGSKKMLHLLPAGESSICTMMLCHRNATVLSELKVVCQNTEHVLRLTLRDPYILLGGGCTETHLATYVRHKVSGQLTETAAALGCSQEECLLGLEGFCRSLQSVAMALEHDGGSSAMDLTHAHHWILPADVMREEVEDTLGPCSCGLVEGGPNKPKTYLSTKTPAFSPGPPCADAMAQPRVLDSFTAKINALQVAVETANLALDVRFVIQDMN